MADNLQDAIELAELGPPAAAATSPPPPSSSSSLSPLPPPPPPAPAPVPAPAPAPGPAAPPRVRRVLYINGVPFGKKHCYLLAFFLLLTVALGCFVAAIVLKYGNRTIPYSNYDSD